MGMFVRALAYMMSHGADGLRQVAEDAVLNANYLRALLQDDLSQPFPGPCMHEVLFDDGFLKDTGITTLDFAKALIDEGYHPMTIYFPLIVHGAMLVEPTETESKAALDEFAAVVKALVAAAPCRRRQPFSRCSPARPAPPAGRDRRRAKAGLALASRSGCCKSSGRVRAAAGRNGTRGSAVVLIDQWLNYAEPRDDAGAPRLPGSSGWRRMDGRQRRRGSRSRQLR